MWKQSSRNTWLKEGDKNTTYFHCRTNQRNLILGLEDENSVWVEDEAEMGGVVGRYFKDIFSSSNPSGFDIILNGIQCSVDVDLDPSLGGEFQACEVKQALNQWFQTLLPALMVCLLFFTSLFGILWVRM